MSTTRTSGSCTRWPLTTLPPALTRSACVDGDAVPFALVGGQAVALWVATRDPAAVRTTKDVDILLQRGDLPRARAAATAADMDYFEVLGVGMFLDRGIPTRATPSSRLGRRESSAGYELPSPADRRAAGTSPGLPSYRFRGWCG